MIYYRTTDRSVKRPPWLDGYAPRLGYAVRETDLSSGGSIVGVCKATQPVPPEDAEWKRVDDEWEVCVPSKIEPEAILRFRHDCTTVPVADSCGTVWMIPTILQPYPLESPALDIAWGDGWQKCPTEQQQRLIDCAAWMRESILSAMPDVADNGSGTVAFELEMPKAGNAISEVLCFSYHLSPACVPALRIVDSTLLGDGMLIASGLRPPSADVADAITEAVQQAVS